MKLLENSLFFEKILKNFDFFRFSYCVFLCAILIVLSLLNRSLVRNERNTFVVVSCIVSLLIGIC